MTSIVLQSKSGPDSKLHLEVPVGQPNTEFEVEVVVRPKPPQGQGWPPGYFGAVSGAKSRSVNCACSMRAPSNSVIDSFDGFRTISFPGMNRSC